MTSFSSFPAFVTELKKGNCAILWYDVSIVHYENFCLPSAFVTALQNGNYALLFSDVAFLDPMTFVIAFGTFLLSLTT